LGQEQNKEVAAKKRAAADPGHDRQVGSALRSVYQKAVDEPVPNDLLDLLGKLS
jgi:hypothetical protein